MNKKTRGMIILSVVLALIATAYAVRVGVVVKYPTSISSVKCVDIADGATGYDVLQAADLKMNWSYFPMLGHALCSINYIGCPSFNCFCDSNEYWNFYVKGKNDPNWTYSPVGFDGGLSCSDHYCAKDGDMLGFSYGPYGTAPPAYGYNDVCCSIKGDNPPCGVISLGEITDYIILWSQGKADLSDVINLINRWQQHN